MRKIPTVFLRDEVNRDRITETVNPECQWVIDGEGVPTRKFDGTCCRITEEGGNLTLWKRYDAKRGKTPPAGFVPAQEPDPITGHHPGWVLCDRSNPADKYFFEAVGFTVPLSPGTYELCGPKVQGNPEGFDCHLLVKHGVDIVADHRTFDSLRDYLAEAGIEGIVFHHPDGRMAKVKARDFGFNRKLAKTDDA